MKIEDKQLTAIVTGASSGIGKSISQKLIRLGYKVYGLGRTFESDELDKENELFHPIICDLLETNNLCNIIKEIKKNNDIFILVNNAGVGYYGLHEELNPQKIMEMTRTNLEIPMIISNLLLRDLKKQNGYIINISSVTSSKSNPHGCAYGATKAGLSSFGESLFDEARKYGLKVVNIQPDMTKSKLYRNANFKESEEKGACLAAKDIANAVEFILSRGENIAITDLKIQPQFHKIERK